MIDHAQHQPRGNECTSWREVYPDTRNLRPERDARGVIAQKARPEESSPVDHGRLITNSSIAEIKRSALEY
jgi:hypothetical protein